MIKVKNLKRERSKAMKKQTFHANVSPV